MAQTFYWHDYETFGTDPSRDRPVQFAGLRTDADLNVIGEPLVLFAKPAPDQLPHPEACLVTGITPQQALKEGVTEAEFIARIHAELAMPGTCGIGYNSLRFDDEVTRYTLYRNFYDAYEREWKNGNSRWDIIDMVRTAYALRPEGINWPQKEDGLPDFRLENLTAANGITHEAAHDALSDVHATIAMARLVREKQPKLYAYLLAQRSKQAVLSHIDMANLKPLLHVSGMFGAINSNIGLIVPLAPHPTNKNEVIAFDLSKNPQSLFELSPEDIAAQLFTRTDELPEGVERPGIKNIHVNRCPVLLPPKMANPDIAARVGLDGALCRHHLQLLREHKNRHGKDFERKLQQVFSLREFAPITDPERALYGGGFFSDADKALMSQVRAASPEALAVQSFPFEDKRLGEMLWRYRARNFPQSLNDEEQMRWEEFRYQRLEDPEAGASLVLEQYHAIIEEKLADKPRPEHVKILEALQAYGDDLLAG